MHSLSSHPQHLSQQVAGCSASAAVYQQPTRLPRLIQAHSNKSLRAFCWPIEQQRLQQQQQHCCAQNADNMHSKLHRSRPPQLSRQYWQHPTKRRVTTSWAGTSNNAPGSSQQQEQQQHVQDSSGNGTSSSSSSKSAKSIPMRITATTDQETYSLEDTKTLVETAMLSAVSGLAFLLSTLLKLDNSLGYFLPLPIAIAACRSGVAAAWHTMMATAFLLLVLLGPLRATTYVLMHGMLAAALGSMWSWLWPWSASILAGAVLRMTGQLGYLVLSSVTMNENLFAVMLANVHNLLDRLSAALGSSGSPSTLTISCMIFALLLVNGICYVFLLHVVYHVILSSMGFKMGPLPGIVKKYLYAGGATRSANRNTEDLV